MVCVALPSLVAVAFLSTPSPPPPASSGGQDMSAYFSTLKTCSTCIDAGYGWCPLRRRCGGFANKECGVGEQYVAEGVKEKKSKEWRRQEPAASTPSGTDLSAEFAKYRDCGSCTAAGYGWCTIQRKCGGFANKECGIGPQYVSSEPAPRNGLWESSAAKKKRESASAPPEVVSVPQAPSPPPATLLHAGPASPPSSATRATAVEAATGAQQQLELEHAATNATTLEENQLQALPHDELVRKVLELQATVQSLRSA
jgi:hypothetical protein